MTWWALFPTWSLLLQTEPTPVSILFPLPYPLERAPVMGWHGAGGNEWNTRTDPEVGGHSLEHVSACVCLSPEMRRHVVMQHLPEMLLARPEVRTQKIQCLFFSPQRSCGCSFQIQCLHLRSGKQTLGTN